MNSSGLFPIPILDRKAFIYISITHTHTHTMNFNDKPPAPFIVQRGVKKCQNFGKLMLYFSFSRKLLPKIKFWGQLSAIVPLAGTTNNSYNNESPSIIAPRAFLSSTLPPLDHFYFDSCQISILSCSNRKSEPINGRLH